MNWSSLTTEQQPVDNQLAVLSSAFVPLIFRFYSPPIGTLLESGLRKNTHWENEKVLVFGSFPSIILSRGRV